MINLITGLPGASKTLYTLTIVDALSKAENRPVFYSGISDLKLEGWTEIEAEKWFECPPGSLVVIDECQRIFRPRTNGTVPPKFVSELETHRHKGIDLFMVTQHPMLADTALRRLAGRHLHVVRTFGMQRSTVHEWGSVKDSCDKTSGRTDSVKHLWSFNKSMFDKYKSAEIHTVKRSLPMRVKILMVLPFLLAGLIYAGYRSFEKKIHPSDPVLTGGTSPVGIAAGIASVKSAGKSGYQNALEDVKQYTFERTPRLANLPFTAPIYDEVTKPTVAPVPVACIQSKSKCTCYSQQGTKLAIDLGTCQKITADGFFLDFDNSGGRSGESARRDVSKVDYKVTHDGETASSIVSNMPIRSAGGKS